MIWAIKDNERLKAKPKQRAICPLCDEEVIAKCGEIKIWHWSHKKDFVCDSFGEPETPWHLEWKDLFPKECQEVILGKHRADIKTKEGLIIEFQNSPISAKEIEKRELFYGNMIWVINGNTIAKNLYITNRWDKEVKSKKIKWYWFPKSWGSSTKQVYVDSNYGKKDTLIKIYFDEDGYGYYTLISKSAFIIEHGGKPKWIRTKKSMQTSLH